MAMTHVIRRVVVDGVATEWWVDGVSVDQAAYTAALNENKALLQAIVDKAQFDQDGRLILPPGRITQFGLPYDPQNRPTVYGLWKAAFLQGLDIDVSGL